MAQYDQGALEALRQQARRHRAEAARLQAQYPGVRPGWVSCDVSMALAFAKDIEAKVAKFEEGF